MARILFLGPGDTCVVFGHTFRRGEPVDEHTLVDHEIERLAGNPTFEVQGSEETSEPATDKTPRRARAKAPGA